MLFDDVAGLSELCETIIDLAFSQFSLEDGFGFFVTGLLVDEVL